MQDQKIPFTHERLEWKFRDRQADALAFIGNLTQEDVINCGTVCLTEIVRQFVIAPPILRMDLMEADKYIIESVDLQLERKTGYTHHSFFIPVERDCEWLEEISSQETNVDHYPLAFLDKKYSRVNIKLTLFPEDKEGELKHKLNHRATLAKQYADSVAIKINDFNKTLAEEMAVELNKRKNALAKADKELENAGLPRVYNPEHKERAVQIQQLMQSLGGYMANSTNQNENTTPSVKAFIVHGHDELNVLALKNYLQNILKLGEPVILREMPGSGKTIIEKFEKYAEEVNLIFVLLTPDDEIVAATASDTAKRQARPNVIFEMGFFLGKLGRGSGRILLLHKGPIELPSDISGVEYIDISGGIQSAGERIRLELRELSILT